MILHPLIDTQIDRGTADNQVLTWNAATQRFEVGTSLSDLTSINMHLSATQDYDIKGDSGDVLSVANTVDDQFSGLRLYSKKGDNGDIVLFQLHGLGTILDRTNRELLDIRTTSSSPYNYEICTSASGEGTVRGLKLCTDGYSQILLKADGTTTFGAGLKWLGSSVLDMSDNTKNFKVGTGTVQAFAITDENGFDYINIRTAVGSQAVEIGDATINPALTLFGTGLTTLGGNLLVNSGNIGITADTNLMQLAANLLTVNGDLDVTGDAEILGNASIGIANDSAMILKFLGENGVTASVGQGVNGVAGTGGDNAGGTAGAGGAIVLTTGDGGESSGGYATASANAGGAFLLTSGNGGDYVGIGYNLGAGSGGSYEFRSGDGGNASGATDGVRRGGLGGTFLFEAGAGGDAVDGGVSTGGKGGDVTLDSGAGGTGATANGLDGNIFLGGTTGNVRVGDTTVPTYALEVAGTVKSEGGRIAPPTSIDNTDSPYTALASDHIILCNTTAGDITINLPAGVTGTIYTIKNTGTGTLTIDGNGAETIEEELTQTISTLNCPKIIFDGTEWWII